ncbi:geranylgeranyl diphosphate synthase, type I [Actinokineospora alba]|uniref:Geranylgeranyl diphosphate synthase, type I n=1 Tax=Actinokineospora alba TaxID=504798 RepID=A0A1H0FAW2_9PSEU|nr:polyprenyl synthetase family protein [Actinokineospora alba]SDI17431.1 geranylgeranyl diphosphate synthase, type I [Actinokineospora alba]SDN91632.1 geranylgeranyl diphosphate synthase, type I [Actinokineospora alba]
MSVAGFAERDSGQAEEWLDPAQLRSTVEALLTDFFAGQERLAPELAELGIFTERLRDLFAAGGKRIRPHLCVCGWRAVRDDPPPPALWRVAASLELFHAFALVHDDVMDRSELRRGRPTAHRAFAARHGHRPDADAFGTDAAILLGDLALGWSFEILHSPDLAPEQRDRVWPILNSLRSETLVGQYLDLSSAGQEVDGHETAWRIVRLKTTKYTFERPLQLGAVLAGADGDQVRVLSDYAVPLGDAFQLRDDLLGVFGDPRQTGKGALDDLRSGKNTVLVATAHDRATPGPGRDSARAPGEPGPRRGRRRRGSAGADRHRRAGAGGAPHRHSARPGARRTRHGPVAARRGGCTARTRLRHRHLSTAS